MAPFHKLQLPGEDFDEKELRRVFIIPRSDTEEDYELISALNERQILRRGIEDEIVFSGYQPVLFRVEERIRRFLYDLFDRQVAENRRGRSRIRKAAVVGAVFAFLNVFFAFYDDLIVDTLLVGIFIVTFYLHSREQRNITQIRERIAALRIDENYLLSDIYASFREIEGSGNRLPDIEAAEAAMGTENVESTIRAIRSYLGLDRLARLKHETQRLRFYLRDHKGLRSWPFQLLLRIRTAQLEKEQWRLKKQKNVRPGYFDIYTYVVEEWEKHKRISPPIETPAEAVEIPEMETVERGDEIEIVDAEYETLPETAEAASTTHAGKNMETPPDPPLAPTNNLPEPPVHEPENS